MITEFMTLTTRRDATIWATEVLGDDHQLGVEQIERLADWIWLNKPETGCQFKDHPLSVMETESLFYLAEAE